LTALKSRREKGHRRWPYPLYGVFYAIVSP
jgi:hypothetical protein